MRKYRVLINGENFLLNFDGRVQKMGFYTNRFVEADNPEDAEQVAIEMMRREDKLKQIVLNDQNDPPKLFVEEIAEVEQLETQQGLSFYSEDENNQE